jgi:hypothetical protein
LCGRERSQGSSLAKSAGAAVTVVVKLVLVKHSCGVALIDDQDAVEELAADGADEAFGDRVGPRRAHRRLDDRRYVVRPEDGVEGGGELGVAIADEEPELLSSLVEVHGQVPGQLSQPRSGRVRGDAEDVDATVGVLDDEERVQPLEGDGVDMKQVAGQDPVRLGPQELGPGGSARRGDGSMPALWMIVQIMEAPIW